MDYVDIWEKMEDLVGTDNNVLCQVFVYQRQPRISFVVHVFNDFPLDLKNMH